MYNNIKLIWSRALWYRLVSLLFVVVVVVVVVVVEGELTFLLTEIRQLTVANEHAESCAFWRQ